MLVHLTGALVYLVERKVHLTGALVYLVEVLVHLTGALVNLAEVLVHLTGALVNLAEALVHVTGTLVHFVKMPLLPVETPVISADTVGTFNEMSIPAVQRRGILIGLWGPFRDELVHLT